MTRFATLFVVLIGTVFAQVSGLGSGKGTELGSLEDLGNIKVSSASLHEQSLQDAPASVTVITAEEIRKHGYRTLAEALSFVRGFYLSYDGTYNLVGLRGFGVPGDWDRRVILLINGHSTMDNIFDMNCFYGQDFPLDMSLIQRIEVVRGPNSALYGSNGVLAVINIITQNPKSGSGGMVRMETGSLGEKKLQTSVGIPLGNEAAMMLSASAFNDSGAQSIYFPQLAEAESNNAVANRMDGQRGYHLFADATWRNWELMAVLGDRVKIQPISWGLPIFNDRGTRAEDSRGFVDLSYTKSWENDREFRWRVFYDAYRYRGTYRYSLEDAIEDNRERDYGDWIGSQVSYRRRALGPGSITIGADFKGDLRALQNAYDVQPEPKEFLRVNRRDLASGVFAQQEWSLGRRWKLDLGGRFDWTHYRSSSFSPRGAVIFQPSSKSTYKFLVGRGFRNPSAYEMFFDDGGISARQNTSLRPETASSFEFVAERRLPFGLEALASVYRYRLDDVIVPVYVDEGVQQFQNLNRVNASGVEFEIAGRPSAHINLLGSFAIQRAISQNRSVLPNSPGQIGKLRVEVPIWGERFVLGAGMQYSGERRTLGRAMLPPLFLPQITLHSRRLLEPFEFTAGIRNLSNTRYSEPVALSDVFDTLPQPGRTFYVSVVWHVRER